MKILIKRNELLSLLVLSIIIMTINIYPLTINASISHISKKVGKKIVEYNIKDYNTDESENFIYKYTDEDRELLELIKKNAEDSFDKLSIYFDNQPQNKITIVIFNDIKTMNSVLNLKDNQKSMGLYYAGFISILSPSAWISDTNIENIEKVFISSGPIVHELTHYFVDNITKSNYPIWFTEGAALYFENIITGFEWGNGKNYNFEGYTINNLTNSFEKLNQDYAYRKSYEIIQDYVNNNSIEDLLNIMKKLGEGYSLEQFGN